MMYQASAMPSYRQKLDSQEVADLVTYLTTLRGSRSHDEQVTFDRIVRAPAEPHNWLTYSGNLEGHRHSLLTQITPGNVSNLELAWAFQALSIEKFEATPLVVDGVLYTVQPPNDVVAIDGASGRIYWTYSHSPSMQARPCCGRPPLPLVVKAAQDPWILSSSQLPREIPPFPFLYIDARGSP